MYELLYVFQGVCRIIDYSDFTVKQVSIYDAIENYSNKGKKIEGLTLDKSGSIISPYRNMSVIYNENCCFDDNIVILAGQENVNIDKYCFKVYFKGANKPCFVYSFSPTDLGILDLERIGIDGIYALNAYELVICGKALKYSICISKIVNNGSIRVIYKDKVPVPKCSTLQYVNFNGVYKFQRWR